MKQIYSKYFNKQSTSIHFWPADKLLLSYFQCVNQKSETHFLSIDNIEIKINYS